jgi:EAL domain-containing protein (putative c-di-GMP-specific phosphodiesterase class I)
MSQWQKDFAPTKPPLTVSVNLSSKQLHQTDLMDNIAAILVESGLEANSLNLEITESALVESSEVMTRHFARLKEMKVRLQLDDFGTGYSSLSYLLRFPIDTLKIDRAFVTNLEEGGETQQIVHTIVTLARHLGMKVIAEGVETAGQVARLRQLGCQYAQGYFFSRPLNAEAAGALIAGEPRW